MKKNIVWFFRYILIFLALDIPYLFLNAWLLHIPALLHFLIGGAFGYIAGVYATRLSKSTNLFDRLFGTPFVIGEEDNPYLIRWFVIPRNRFFNIYLHNFRRSDDDRALHDHPWNNCSILLKGEYVEIGKDEKEGYPFYKFRSAGHIAFRQAESAHRIELYSDEKGKPIPVWTLFLTGPVRRRWGFHCPQGWRHWKEFVSLRDGGNSVGRGCD